MGMHSHIGIHSKPSVRMEASLFPIQLLYTTHIENTGSLIEWKPRFLIQLLYTTHIEKADSVRMEASLFLIQLLYTTPIEKTGSLI